MLSQITIRNFAIIDNLEINFKDGLTVLTGETGAGKSIIADALDFLLGSRGNTDLIKTGTNKALVEGLFSINENSLLMQWFEKNGFDFTENSITISRELTLQGSKARINGSLANVSHLSYLREHLIDIHEQSGHIDLLKIEKQLEILDNFGDLSHKKLVSDYKRLFEEYQSLKTKLNLYLENSNSLLKRIDFIEFQIKEIKDAQIKDINEEEDLKVKREILLNKKELIENSKRMYELINGDGVETSSGISLQATLSEIKKLLIKSSNHDKLFKEYIETIETMTSEIKELSSCVNSYSEGIEEGDDDLTETEERLDLFFNLKKKYGNGLNEILQYLKTVEDELVELKQSSTSHEELENKLKQKEKDINDLALKLTRSREKITEDFVNKINEELLKLGFKHALFVVEHDECELSQYGKETIQFLFTANPDEPPKPLLKVASGGELSRIMLAIKDVSANWRTGEPAYEKNKTLTMIFDEIDMGVSGEIADSVAKMLYKISRQNQVICITHQPIIAAMADSHFVIEKKISDSLTQIHIKEVIQEEKTEALAALLSPNNKSKDNLSTDARQFAKSLLENANRIKVGTLDTTSVR